MIKCSMTLDDAKNAADMMEFYFFQNIRDDEDMDNIEYVRSILRGMDALRAAEKCDADDI